MDGVDCCVDGVGCWDGWDGWDCCDCWDCGCCCFAASLTAWSLFWCRSEGWFRGSPFISGSVFFREGKRGS